ncbi:MAG: hypothetical protein KGI59_00305 [Patescibacteria group bacterium]|nr:hypothetical protein [Patescibacteria group bacterium]MDE2172696.1 hypothetical protein [Patescibacteria group bacterium]
MRYTRTATLRLLRTFIVIFILSVIVAYAVWRSSNYTRGPAIYVATPADGATTGSSTLEIRGQVSRVTDLTLNDRPISVDQQGNFDEIIAVLPGINKLTLAAHDQFGRQTHREIDVYGQQSPSSTATSAIPESNGTTTATGTP